MIDENKLLMQRRLNQIEEHLQSACRIIENCKDFETSYQSLINASAQAQQSARDLSELAGFLYAIEFNKDKQ